LGFPDKQDTVFEYEHEDEEEYEEEYEDEIR
jgi:hypothetical protein